VTGQLPAKEKKHVSSVSASQEVSPSALLGLLITNFLQSSIASRFLRKDHQSLRRKALHSVRLETAHRTVQKLRGANSWSVCLGMFSPLNHPHLLGSAAGGP